MSQSPFDKKIICDFEDFETDGLEGDLVEAS